MLDLFERRNPVQFAAQIEALPARPDATALPGTLRCPTLLRCGREDGWSPRRATNSCTGALPAPVW